ncbi:MAG: hypothetical protein VX507_02810, partial [Gemmatimonadota bacterium]|nr:hypothetical protein [Gemmatimonadota bacterium]
MQSGKEIWWDPEAGGSTQSSGPLNHVRPPSHSMIYKSPCLLIDVVDPLSFFAHLQVGSVEQATGTVVQRIPVELRPPPAELIDADHPFWLQRWKQAEALAEEFSLSLKKPRLMPWSRKA